jgi:subtilisin family serine protease
VPIHREYNFAMKGFVARLTSAQLQTMSRDQDVAYIEPDSEVHDLAEEASSSWGLDRIDQKWLPLNSTYHYDVTGIGVTAYVIDTGIQIAHQDFGGRAHFGYDFEGGSSLDCNGHGTHVAGTIGGTTYGVAKGVTLVSVRVLDCAGNGSTSGVISGIDWMTKQTPETPKVANMSLGGSKSKALNDAVSQSIKSGVTFAVAAGNEQKDACSTSPASTQAALTVGASDSTDTRAYYSNYGSCLDLFAPGSDIASDWIGGSNNATATHSGTSMASPHVAGVAALYLSTHLHARPADVRAALVTNATSGSITDARSGSPNKLLYSLIS